MRFYEDLRREFFGNVQKCLHGLIKRSLTTSRTSDRAGTFSEVTGGRASSFHDLSVGEAPAPSEREGNGGGGKFPSQISRRKDQPGRLGTEEKAPALSRYHGPMSTLLNVTAFLAHSNDRKAKRKRPVTDQPRLKNQALSEKA